MIDFNKLDKRSKYCLLEYGTGLIAKQIKRFSKENKLKFVNFMIPGYKEDFITRCLFTPFLKTA